MAALELGIEAATVPVWLAGALAAIILAAAVLAWRRGWTIMPGLAVAVALALVLGGAGLLASRPQPRPEDPSADRHRLVERADALAARALAPNSLLACVDASAGPPVEKACEALVFGRPETIAAAVAYVEAKLALLSDAAALVGNDAAKSGAALAALRRGLEADRFGIVAQVLVANSACSADRCAAFALVADAERIKSNMREGAFDRLVAQYAVNWPAGDRGVAATEAAPRKGAAGAAPVAKPLSSRYDFPSAASIPPVSIMTAEPPRPPEPAAASAAPAAESAAPPKPSPPASGSTPLPRPAPRSASAPVSIVPARPAPSAGETPR